MSSPEYQILYTDSLGELECLVRECLETGWLPQGGVSTAFDPDGNFWAAQSMFRIKGAIRTQVLNVADDGVSVNDE